MSKCMVCGSLDSTKLVSIPNCNPDGKGTISIWNAMCTACAKKYEDDYNVKELI